MLFQILILTIATLNQAFAQIPWPGGCPDIPPMKNLDLERYAGDWFEVQRYFFIPELTGQCVSVNYFIRTDSTISTTIRFINDPVSQIPMAFNGITRFLDPVIAEGDGYTGNLQLTLNIVNPLFPQVKVQQTYNYKMVDTDYDNYIIKWACSSIGLVHFESVWILARDKSYPDPVKAAVLDKLKELGINKDLLVPSPCFTIPGVPAVPMPSIQAIQIPVLDISSIPGLSSIPVIPTNP